MIGVGKLQRQISVIISSFSEDPEESFVVSNNQPKAVLMGLERYEELRCLEAAREKEELEVLAVVEKGDQEFKMGRTVKSKSLKELM